MLSFLKLSIFWATVAALAVIVSSEVVSDFCRQIEEIQPCSMQAVLEVDFGKCGARVLASEAKRSPSVVYMGAEPDKQYLLVMVDPDAPSAKEPTYRYWRHWVVAGIPGSSLKTGSIQGNTLSKYAGPSPPRLSGPHRYQIFLFSYTGNLNSENVFNDKDRGSWNVVDYIRQNGLCNSLVAGYEFISENNY